MTSARRRLVVLGIALAVMGGVSACKVPHRVALSTRASAPATASQLDMIGSGDVRRCRFSARDVSAALGGVWAVTSLPSGGCTYSRSGRSILVSEVPLPRDHSARMAALAQSRTPCDTGSARSIAAAAGAFVCRQGALVEAATLAGGRLVVLSTAAGSDPGQLPGIQAGLGRLLARLE